MADGIDDLPITRGLACDFDAYWMIDWSSRGEPVDGADSVWWALLCWDGGRARVETRNCSTRSELTNEVIARLGDELRELRVLVGFDFPFGYPRGFARALGHAGSSSEAWRTTWARITRDVRDDGRNANNRFAVAAALNAAASGAYGPFYGRPAASDPKIASSLSTKQDGYFAYPLRTLTGDMLERTRETDRRGRTASTPWFVFGGGNSVGGQALVGIPRVAQIRARLPDARIWPFETGGTLPTRAEARVVLAEVYPSLFHAREKVQTDVHDRLQVIATAVALARKDADGTLRPMFAAPSGDCAAASEEGWILGVT